MTELAEAVNAIAPDDSESTQRPSADLAQVKTVADNVVKLLRTFNRVKARMIQATEHDVEWAAHVVLRCLKNEGPMRVGSIAETLQNDPSTVSRLVASLVKDGLLERRADPDDGRASLLVLTDAAEAVLREHDRIRLEYFGALLNDWSAEDLTAFAAHLDRFTSAYEVADDHWITNRLANRAGREGSTH